uniref:Uncharacterized protein n=1 Tax=Caenorhabditis tropicalis TaxID=1561998 RepID=A0A1I7SXM1_9PELO
MTELKKRWGKRKWDGEKEKEKMATAAEGACLNLKIGDERWRIVRMMVAWIEITSMFCGVSEDWQEFFDNEFSRIEINELKTGYLSLELNSESFLSESVI